MIKILVTIAVITVGISVLVAGCVQKKKEWVLDILLRGMAGMAAIFFINQAFSGLGVGTLVGINPATLLTCGILGFPGLVALYGLGFYKSL